ncbi:MAG: lipid-A-disaccharide synthase N-terminal domain-containing protein [Pseudomonadota bacterium]|nr:lipid-A-disaccharide synthase N-terminal domain-containing protein [Pseudomonadota bacterium]
MAEFFGSWAHNFNFWLAVGFLGQAIFASRFIVQWLYSERARRVVVPTVFWWISLCGGLILTAYAVHKRDLVFTLGQFSGLFVYSRNLWLLHTSKRAEVVSD